MRYIIFVTFVGNFMFSTYTLGAEEGMPQLNPEFWFSQAFWLILVFSLLYIIICKTILPKITDNLENRKKTISNDLEETQRLKEIAEKKSKEYDDLIKNTKIQASRIISENKLKLEKNLSQKEQDAQKEIDHEIEEIEEQIEKFKKQSLESICKIAKEISAEVIKKLLKTEVNESSLSAIVNETSQKRLKNNL